MRKSFQIEALKNVAEIISGYPFRSRIEPDLNGNISIVQLKDVDDYGRLSCENLNRVNLDVVKEHLFLHEGDILFKSKSSRLTAVPVLKCSENTIATAHYFILRLKSDILLPEYLAWFINQKKSQRYLQLQSAGTRLPVVNKKILENLKVVIPPLERQEKIVRVYELFLKEKAITEKILELKETLVSAKLTTGIE